MKRRLPSETKRQPSSRSQAARTGGTAPMLGNQAMLRELAGRSSEPESPEPLLIQRLPENGAPASPQAEVPPAQGAEPQPAEAAARAPWLVEDDTSALAGQMRKSAFLEALRTAVCHTANEGMAGTGQTSAGCPWIEHWFGVAAEKPAGYVDRALGKFAPESALAATAEEAIPLIAARVRRSVDQWALTGEISGLPDDMPVDLPGAGLLGGMFFKGARAGTPRAADPGAVRARLGPGRPLAGQARERMEGAFGESFAHVRLHTDATAGAIAGSLEARAFTVGDHVAFAPGEFAPDSLPGQALLAHELAHVVQQRGGAAGPAIRESGGQESPALERDADAIAVGAVVSIMSGARNGLARVSRNAVPALKSGLRLQRCPDKKDPVPTATPQIEATEEAMGRHAAACMIRANESAGKAETTGIYYAHEYKGQFPNKWKEDYRNGYANDRYWKRIASMQWKLKPGRSASAAVKDWLKGLTIAECASTTIVIEVDTIRAAIGDARFDELYGSQEKDVGEANRLEMGINGATPLAGTLTGVDIAARGGEGTMGYRPAKVGEWYYFYNHPKYLLKHPAGVFQGENAMLLEQKTESGEQLWSGLGESGITERQMLGDMMDDYNDGRRPWDLKRLDEIKAKNGGTLPPRYDEASGIFQDRITIDKILNDPPYALEDPFTGKVTTRKGGFVPSAGRHLDPAAVQKLRDGK